MNYDFWKQLCMKELGLLGAAPYLHGTSGWKSFFVIVLNHMDPHSSPTTTMTNDFHSNPCSIFWCGLNCLKQWYECQTCFYCSAHWNNTDRMYRGKVLYQRLLAEQSDIMLPNKFCAHSQHNSSSALEWCQLSTKSQVIDAKFIHLDASFNLLWYWNRHFRKGP